MKMPTDIVLTPAHEAAEDPFGALTQRPLVSTGRPPETDTGSGFPAAPAQAPVSGQPVQGNAPAVLIGELIALSNPGCTPLVVYAGQPGTAALAARSTVDLHGAHIGRQVVLTFDGGDPGKPIVMGVLRQGGWPLPDPPGQVEVDVDGERLSVTAREQLVLRCGAASITLTRAGKVLIQGSYILSRSSGVNRVKGGSIELN